MIACRLLQVVCRVYRLGCRETHCACTFYSQRDTANRMQMVTLDGVDMSYTLTMHKPDLMWVVMQGHLDIQTANAYFDEVWQRLDACPNPTDMLVDGRQMKNAKFEARRRTEQVIHHPNLGNMAFIVSQTHLLWLAPLARLVNGIGLFGNEQEALAFLHTARENATTRNVDIFKGQVPEHPFAQQAAPQPAPPATPEPATAHARSNGSSNGNGHGHSTGAPRQQPANGSSGTNGAQGAYRPEPAKKVYPTIQPVATPPPVQPVVPASHLGQRGEAMPERPERRRR